MGLVTLKEILAGTKEEKYGVGSFNFNTYEDAVGIVQGAVNKKSTSYFNGFYGCS